MPHDLPPWQVVYQQAQRWMKAGCFEEVAHDLRKAGASGQGTQSCSHHSHNGWAHLQKSEGQAGYDGYKWRKGSKVHIAMDTLGSLAG